MPLPSPPLHLFLLTPAPDVTYCVATMTLCGEHYTCMPTNRQVGRPLVTDFQDEEFTLGILRNSGIPRNSSGMSRGLLGIPDLWWRVETRNLLQLAHTGRLTLP